MTTLSPAHRSKAPRAGRLAPFLSILAVALLATGCGRNEPAAAADASQVAAKVDGTEISVHQINYVLKRNKANPDSPESAKALRKQVLDKLVDQQLLVQKAVEDKLDRTPEVQMGLEAARRDVLADAYLQQVTATSSKPSDADLRKYYVEHPQLFSQRRVFQLQEITFSAKAPEDAKTSVKALVESGRPIDEVQKALTSRGVEFAKADTQRASEQISLELLPRMYGVRAGQGLIASNAQATTVIYVKAFEEAPVGQDAAMPRIAQFLTNQSLSENVSGLVKSLRTKAKLEYVGEFAEAEPAVPVSQK